MFKRLRWIWKGECPKWVWRMRPELLDRYRWGGALFEIGGGEEDRMALLYECCNANGEVAFPIQVSLELYFIISVLFLLFVASLLLS